MSQTLDETDKKENEESAQQKLRRLKAVGNALKAMPPYWRDVSLVNLQDLAPEPIFDRTDPSLFCDDSSSTYGFVWGSFDFTDSCGPDTALQCLYQDFVAGYGAGDADGMIWPCMSDLNGLFKLRWMESGMAASNAASLYDVVAGIKHVGWKVLKKHDDQVRYTALDSVTNTQDVVRLYLLALTGMGTVRQRIVFRCANPVCRRTKVSAAYNSEALYANTSSGPISLTDSVTEAMWSQLVDRQCDGCTVLRSSRTVEVVDAPQRHILMVFCGTADDDATLVVDMLSFDRFGSTWVLDTVAYAPVPGHWGCYKWTPSTVPCPVKSGFYRYDGLDSPCEGGPSRRLGPVAYRCPRGMLPRRIARPVMVIFTRASVMQSLGLQTPLDLDLVQGDLA